jgi:hypothetical protein
MDALLAAGGWAGDASRSPSEIQMATLPRSAGWLGGPQCRRSGGRDTGVMGSGGLSRIVSRRRGGVSIALAALLLVSCASGVPSDALPSTTLSPRSPSADQSVLALPSVTASPSPSPSSAASEGLAHDSIAQVVTDDLVVRSEPGVREGSKIYPVRLNEPTLLYVADGPLRASGFDWYLVQPFEVNICMDVCPERPRFGWVAQSGQDGEVWVAPGAVSCPPVSVAEVQWLTSMARLACFGDQALVFRGTMGPCFAPAGAAIPALLVEGCMLYRDDYVAHDGFGEPSVFLRYGATAFPNLEGERVRVTGQFDHPKADECGSDPETVLLCRGEFVVSEISIRD